MSSTGGCGGLPPPTTSATAARVQLLHRRSNSVGCSRSLSLLMAACGDILSQQQRAEQLVGMMGERPAPLPVSVVDRCLWSMAEPNLDMAGAFAAPPVDHPATVAEPMDETVHLKRQREARHGSESERDSAEEGGDAIGAAARPAAAIERSCKRRARGREAELTSRGSAPLLTPAVLLLPGGSPPRPDDPAASSPIELAGSACPSLPPAAACSTAATPGAAQHGGALGVNKQAPGSPPVNAAPCSGRSGDPTPSGLAGDHSEGTWSTPGGKAARRKARKLAARRPIVQPAAGTCLFRPVDRTASFLASSREAIARELAATSGVSQ